MKKIVVNSDFNNKKLDIFLFKNFPTLTKNILYKTLRKKDIKVNGKRINDNINVFENDVIELYISDELLEFRLNIIYEDENILVINKPYGIEVTGNNSLTDYVQKKYSKSVNPCHRLDRNTFGLILFAKNKLSLDTLLEKFKNKEVEKHYLAFVYGIPKLENNTLISYLFKDSKKSLVYISDIYKKGYQKIVTSYSIINVDKKNNTSILDIEIKTGKTHQIRAHLAHIGYPIIGDGKYGINSINKKFGYKTQQLCSYKLKFNFCSDSRILNYLNGKEFKIKETIF